MVANVLHCACKTFAKEFTVVCLGDKTVYRVPGGHGETQLLCAGVSSPSMNNVFTRYINDTRTNKPQRKGGRYHRPWQGGRPKQLARYSCKQVHECISI